mgnify:CR=1 FL=1
MRAEQMPTSGHEALDTWNPDVDPFDPERVGFTRAEGYHWTCRGWRITEYSYSNGEVSIWKPGAKWWPDDYGRTEGCLFRGALSSHNATLDMLRANGWEG